MSASASFDGLPPECIQAIAVRACEEPFLGPPTALATLLRVSRRTNAALCVQHNPTLHARVFAAKFDTVAPARRFADAGQPLAAGSWAAELRRRWICLRRIRHVSAVGRLGVVSEEEQQADLWLIYLMFLESDGKNFDQLLHWARVSGYIRTVIRDLLSPAGLPRPGYPTESTPRALGLWLMWFLTEVHTVVAEVESDTAQIHNMLRPWALASHKFDTLCAPFTHWNLPAPQGPTLGEDPMALTPHYPADLDLRDRTEVVSHMGRRIHLAPPRASLAAIMAFMVRLERNGPIPPHPAPPLPTPPGNNQFPSTIANPHPGLTIYPRTRFPAWYGPGCTEFDGRVNRKGSAAYDSEWRRLLQCGNPFLAPRFKTQPTFCPGDLAGDWEGRFVFLTFDAFRDMLAGFMPAVQSGLLAQQPHVWRIREHHCLRRRRRFPIGRDDESIGEPLPVGNALDAFIPANAEFMQHGGEPIGFGPNPGRRLEVRIPDESSMEGFRSYNYTTIDGPTDLPPTHIPTTSVLSPIPPPLDHMPDWDNAVYGSGWPTGDDEWEEEVVDTIITGEGHSSWGTFHLRGRIRAWDGMIILVKDYVGQNNGRGRWLYKGYIVAGGNWVGRWRDTFTAEHLSGYEGVFSVTRRF